MRGELDRLEGLLTADGYEGPIMAWDWRYYDDALRRTEYGVDQDRISEYLPLDPTIEGMFEITGEVFGLEYRVLPEAHAWHESVRLYEILDKAIRQVSRPLLRRPLPARGQVRARGGLPARRRPSRGRWRVRGAGERDRRELHATVGRPAVAPAALRGLDALPRVRPHPAHEPHARRVRPIQRLPRPSGTSWRRRPRSWSTGRGPHRSWRGSRATTRPVSRCRPS